jgi:copper chaperone
MSGVVEKVTLTAPDISCSHCVATIDKALGGLDGVQHVETSEATKKIEVSYDPRKVTLLKIKEVLDDEGYPVQQ